MPMNADMDPAPNSGSQPPPGSEPGKAVSIPSDASPDSGATDRPARDERALLRLELAPWPEMDEPPRERAEAPQRPKRSFAFEDPIGFVAGLTTLGLLGIGALALHDHFVQSEFSAAKTREIAMMTGGLEKLEAQSAASDDARAHEMTAEIKKLLGEVKVETTTNRDFSGQLAQFGQRLDRLEKDQSARLDKLGDHFDHETAPRFAELVTRVEKLEKRSAAAVAAAPVVEPPPRPSAAPPTPANVANDITGSIQRPKPMPVLRDYALEEIRNGMAFIDGRDGPYTVAPGDLIPGAGRVLKIERRGRDWVVVTSIGIIGAPPE